MSGTTTAKPDADLPFSKRRHYLDRTTLRELVDNTMIGWRPSPRPIARGL